MGDMDADCAGGRSRIVEESWYGVWGWLGMLEVVATGDASQKCACLFGVGAFERIGRAQRSGQENLVRESAAASNPK